MNESFIWAEICIVLGVFMFIYAIFFMIKSVKMQQSAFHKLAQESLKKTSIGSKEEDYFSF
jgi:hypothetical protein